MLRIYSPTVRAFLVTLVALGGCGGDLPVASFVEKLRVLAVQAEPPEVAPGETTQLDVLAVQPPVPMLDGGPPSPTTYLWLACRIAPGASEQLPCGLQADQRVTQTLPPDCKDEPSAPLCYLGTDRRASYTPDAGALGDDGTGQVLITTVVADTPEGAIGCLLAAAENDARPQDPDHCVLSLKRLRVSAKDRLLPDGKPAVPNQNPRLVDFGYTPPTGDGVSLFEAQGFDPAPEQDAKAGVVVARRTPESAELEPAYDDEGAFTGYQYEQLTVSWFVTAGSLSSSRALFRPADPACPTQLDCPMTPPDELATTKWTPPTAGEADRFTTDGTVHFYAVVRDDRGGVSWVEGSLTRR